MTSPRLFHICPRDLKGCVLHPLSELELLYPEVAERARRKYIGREWLPTATVPALACRWMDTVMFTPVHPLEMTEALASAGHPHLPRQWIQIDAEQLDPERTIAFQPGDSPEADAFVPFTASILAAHSALSSAQRAAYVAGEPGRTLLFGQTLHVLHRKRSVRCFADRHFLSGIGAECQPPNIGLHRTAVSRNEG